VRRAERLFEELDSVDPLQGRVRRIDVLRRGEVDAEGEAAERVRDDAEVRLVVLAP
jgi:hypothetical protein